MADERHPNDAAMPDGEASKVDGEGPATVSQTAATSGGAAGLEKLDPDPDASPPADPGDHRAGPSMTAFAADSGRRPAELSSFAPDGEPAAEAEAAQEAEDQTRVRGAEEERPSRFHERQPRS